MSNSANNLTIGDLPAATAGHNGWPWTTAGDSRQKPTGPVGKSAHTITLVTPSLNQGEFLEETIRSVLLQDYPSVEYVVMDGGSADDSPAIIEKYSPWLAHWSSRPDQGQSDAINRGLAKGSGEICGWLCSDDVLTPGALRTVGRHFAEHPDCQWLAGAADFVDIHEGPLGRSQAGLDGEMSLLDYWRWGMAGHALPQPACFWRRSLWDRAGGLTVGNHLAMDFDLWLKFQEMTELHVLDATLAVCKVHPTAKTRRLRRELYAARRQCALTAARRRGVPAARVLWRKIAWTFAWRFRRLLGKTQGQRGS